MKLARAFVAALPEARAADWPLALLEPALVRLLEAARAVWPEVALAGDVFARHLSERAADLAALERLNGPGLYLACACARGEPAAIRLFHARFVPEVARVFARMRVAELEAELTQRLLDRLFVVERGVAGIAGYAGTGELLAWVRVVAAREAYQLLRQERQRQAREPGGLEAPLEAAAAEGDVELMHLKASYRAAFKLAFERAFTALEPRDRTLLRYHLVDGLRLEQVGAIYGFSRATAARRLEAARERLRASTRERLAETLDVSRVELDSLMALIDSRLELSLTRLLRD